mmetsp:Transcript_3767/g.12566  ORF Transcript_3767/g.12566 Transcript_3767/m.12566 type:complete len:267 (-) Transcript_3767:75-875(-)
MRWTCMYVAELSQPPLHTDSSLRKFPYDEHELCIDAGVRSGPFQAHASALATVADNERITRDPAGCVHTTAHSAEFEISPILQAVLRNAGDGPEVSVRVRIWRKPGYYERNLLYLNLVATSLALAAFAMAAEELGDRSAIILSVLFALVGLRFGVDAQLPKVELATFAQREINGGIYLLGFALFQSAAVHWAWRIGVDEASLDVADACCAVLMATAIAARGLRLCIMRRRHTARRPPSRDSADASKLSKRPVGVRVPMTITGYVRS